MTDITINTCHKLRDVSPLLYGIFFEDINYAGDGGLYGELIANRSFEYYDRDGETDKSKMCWETIGNGNLSVSKRFPLSQAHSHYGRLSGEAGDGIRNLGFCGEGLAVREGEVVHIEAQQGRPEVKLGDVVVKGQLLIAGLYQEVPDPYGPQPDRLYQVAGAARGKVLAKTYREFTVQVEDSVQETQEAGREVRLWAEIFGLRLPLGLWSRTEGETQSWREERRASLLGVELPLALEWETLVRLERRERKLTKEQMKTAALLKLREAQRTALGEGGSVLHEELSFTFAEGRCMVSARCRCQENIGEIQVVSTN